MIKRLFICFCSLILLTLSVPTWAATDDEVRQMIIIESIRSYPGNCPCPYNRARNGSRCGRRSAWSKPGGYQPICYPREVSDEMVRDYRRKRGIK